LHFLGTFVFGCTLGRTRVLKIGQAAAQEGDPWLKYVGPRSSWLSCSAPARHRRPAHRPEVRVAMPRHREAAARAAQRPRVGR
jgi:hypothetical protein